jgi:hypothetical protein
MLGACQRCRETARDRLKPLGSQSNWRENGAKMGTWLRVVVGRTEGEGFSLPSDADALAIRREQSRATTGFRPKRA